MLNFGYSLDELHMDNHPGEICSKARLAGCSFHVPDFRVSFKSGHWIVFQKIDTEGAVMVAHVWSLSHMAPRS